MPGRVFTIWNAGRSTSPVAFSAPETSTISIAILDHQGAKIQRIPHQSGSLFHCQAFVLTQFMHMKLGISPSSFRGCLDQQF